jgi:hypothetical protein
VLDRSFVELLGYILFVELVESMLFGEFAKVAGDWLCHNGRIVVCWRLCLGVLIVLWWKQ